MILINVEKRNVKFFGKLVSHVEDSLFSTDLSHHLRKMEISKDWKYPSCSISAEGKITFTHGDGIRADKVNVDGEFLSGVFNIFETHGEAGFGVNVVAGTVKGFALHYHCNYAQEKYSNILMVQRVFDEQMGR